MKKLTIKLAVAVVTTVVAVVGEHILDRVEREPEPEGRKTIGFR